MSLFKKTFRKKALAMVSSVLALVMCFGFYTGNIAFADEVTDLEKKIEQGKKQLEQYESDIEKYKDDLENAKKLQEAVMQKLLLSEQIIDDYSSQLGNLDSQIKTKQAEITEKENQIKQKETEIADTQTEIDENLVLFAEKIRALYISGNDDFINVLMGSGDFFSMMLNYKFTENITEQNVQFMTDLKENIENLENDKQVLEGEKQVLEEQRQALEEDLEKYESLVSKEREQAAQYQKDLNKYGSLVDDAEYAKAQSQNKKKATQKQIEEMEALITQLIEEKSRKDTEFEGGEWGWPMPGYYTITSPFGRRDFAPNPNHKGNDIAGRNAQGEAINGKTIVSANDGVVILVNQYGYGGGYGTYVTVDHGGGYTTFYAHMQTGSAVVSEGQRVKRGDALGRVGSTGLSTGPHLHFEIRKNNVPTEPISYYPHIKFIYAY